MDRLPGAFGFADAEVQELGRGGFVRTVEHHPEIDSTNSRALSLAEDPGLPLPALVLTDLQTAGRGRGANRWWSARGALTFSLILPRPDVTEEASWPRVALTAGVAVCDALQQLRPGLEIGLKWPNDVYVQSRKIGGILVETSPRSPARLVLGIGLNVNNSLAEAPPPLATSVTSLIDVAGYPFDLTVVLVCVLRRLADHLTALDRAEATRVDRWQELCMLSGRSIRVETGRRTTVGVCQGIDRSGALLVDTAAGRERCVSGIVTRLD